MVPNGTFRELQYDDTVNGPPGSPPVRLTKGAMIDLLVFIVSVLSHRNNTKRRELLVVVDLLMLKCDDDVFAAPSALV